MVRRHIWCGRGNCRSNNWLHRRLNSGHSSCGSLQLSRPANRRSQTSLQRRESSIAPIITSQLFSFPLQPLLNLRRISRTVQFYHWQFNNWIFKNLQKSRLVERLLKGSVTPVAVVVKMKSSASNCLARFVSVVPPTIHSLLSTSGARILARVLQRSVRLLRELKTL